MGFSLRRSFRRAIRAPSRAIARVGRQATALRVGVQKSATRIGQDVRQIAPLVASVAIGPLAGEALALALDTESPAAFMGGAGFGAPVAPVATIAQRPRTRIAAQRDQMKRQNADLGTIASQATPVGTGDPRFTRGAIVGATSSIRPPTFAQAPPPALTQAQSDQVGTFIQQVLAAQEARLRAELAPQRFGGGGFGFGF